MSHHVIDYDCECESCKGTGLYVGFAEKDCFAVQCHACNGTGKVHRKIKYNDFDTRKRREGIEVVLHTNPGIVVGLGDGRFGKDTYGGISYEDWLQGKQFPIGSEMRNHVCPCWWYQSADYKKKPDWRECTLGRPFYECSHFKDKSKCWERWDKEFKNK